MTLKDINKIDVEIPKLLANLLKKNLVNAQRVTANKIKEDAIGLLPFKNGEYIDSIHVEDTEINGDVISTKIVSDLFSEDGYAIGRMIENGTGIYALEDHIGHTKTFKDSGYHYWYVPATSVKRPIGEKITINGKEFYIGKPQVAKPHFIPALEMNKNIYKQNIGKAIIGIKQ